MFPNPFEGIVIEALYSTNYTTRSVRFDDVISTLQSQQPPSQSKEVLKPILPILTVHTEMLPEKESADLDPLLKKPLLTPKTTPKSSPLYIGRPVVPPPPPLSLLEIAKSKRIVIEY